MSDDVRPDDSKSRARRSPVPYSEASEANLIGGSLWSAKTLEVLATQTRPEDFYVPRYRKAAEVLTELYANGDPVDPIILRDEFQRRGDGDVIEDAELVALQSNATSPSTMAKHAEIVHNHATARRLIEAGERINQLGYGSLDVHEAVLEAHELLGGVAKNNGSRTYSTLSFGDVGALLRGEVPDISTEILARSDGKMLFYPGRMHVLQSEPSTGKSWVALLACVEVLQIGGAVIYLDYEDSMQGIVGRLVALGAEPQAIIERFCYVRPEGPFDTTERAEIEHKVEALNPDLVIIDGVAEALTRDGLSEDRAGEVVTWIEKLPRWFARSGAAVVMLDHVAKDRENRGRWARGSGAKLSVIDGAAYELKVVQSFSRHREGSARLVIAKDRPGHVGEIGATAAMVHFDPSGAGEVMRIRLEPPTPEGGVAASFKPTVIMQQVSDELENAVTALTTRSLKSILSRHKAKLVEEAVARLIAEGYARTFKTGSTSYLKLVYPYNHGNTPPTADVDTQAAMDFDDTSKETGDDDRPDIGDDE